MPCKSVKNPVMHVPLRLKDGILQRTVKPVLLADTFVSLGSCRARSVHEEEDVPGPDDLYIAG